MVDNLEHLRRMAVFAAVVDSGGFAAAARRLGMTRSAVSKQVGVLEGALGARLLQRTTRSIRLTEVGALFHPRCQALVEGAESAWTEARAQVAEPRGRLVATAPLGLGEAFVAPLLPAFLGRYPAVEVSLTLSDEVVDLVAEGIDVAIRAGRLEDSALIARRLTSVPLVVCAAPAYLAAAGTPSIPEDLAAHDWITYTPLGIPNRLAFRRGDALHKVRPGGRATTNNGAVIRALLLAGRGVSLLPRFYVREDLDAGRLVPVLEAFDLPTAGVFAVHPHVRHVPLKVRAFIDHLAAS